MVELKSSAEIARLIPGLSEDDIKYLRHHSFVAGYLSAVIQIFLTGAEKIDDIDEMKAHIRESFKRLVK